MKGTIIGYARLLRDIARRIWAVIVGADAAELARLKRRGRVEFGHATYGIPTIRTYPCDETRLIVGNYCSIAGGATFLLGGNHPTDRITTYPHRIMWNMPGLGNDGYPLHTGDTVVGSDVWICTGALIVSGVQIGHGAIVVGGAVVTRDVPPYAIVGGNPARIIRYRFSEAERDALLATEWWNWPEDTVRAAVPLLSEGDLDAFLAYANTR